MKKSVFDGTLEFITPCFCAGSDQSKAEVRAPSIRGELRWWFRALGGSQKEEQEVFGGISGDDGISSALLVRVSMLPKQKDESSALPANHRFFTMSRKGNESVIPAGRCFNLKLLQRRTIEDNRLGLAIEAMLLFGAIGLRSNRGCGAMQIQKNISKAEVLSVMAKLSRVGFLCFARAPEQSGVNALQSLEDAIKQLREAGVRKNERNAMGFVLGQDRHASCLRTRPVKLDNGTYLPVLLYTEAAMGNVRGIRAELESVFS